MKIAVVGAGLAGLGVTAALLDISYAGVMVDLYDPLEIGEGVSGLSSGLLHPFAGLHARRLWKADLGLEATHSLLTEASRAQGSSCILSKGILRPSVTDEQRSDFKHTADTHSECDWWDAKKCANEISGLVCKGGLFVKEGLTIDVKGYLRGLFKACALRGAQHIKQKVTSLEKLAAYDHIIFSAGTGCLDFTKLPVAPVKGQLLELAWPEGVPPLPFSLVSKGYIVMGKGGESALVGATFERNFTSTNPDPKVANDLLREKASLFLPALKEAPLLNVYAGVRVSSKKNHLPILGQLAPKYWVLTALGSKGLIYHAWLGRCLAKAILDENDKAILKEVSLAYHSQAPRRKGAKRG